MQFSTAPSCAPRPSLFAATRWTRSASSLEQGNPNLHRSGLPVRPCIVRNERKRRFSCPLNRTCVARIQGTIGIIPVVHHTCMVKHEDSPQQVTLLRLELGVRSLPKL